MHRNCKYQFFGEREALLCNRVRENADKLLLTIQMTSTDSVRVFLPRPFTLIFSDDHIDMINNGMIKINFIFYNICEKTNAYMLSLNPV